MLSVGWADMLRPFRLCSCPFLPFGQQPRHRQHPETLHCRNGRSATRLSVVGREQAMPRALELLPASLMKPGQGVRAPTLCNSQAGTQTHNCERPAAYPPLRRSANQN